MRRSFKKAAARPWFAESLNRGHPRATRRTPRKLEVRHHGDRHSQLYSSHRTMINTFLSVDEPFLIAVAARSRAPRHRRGVRRPGQRRTTERSADELELQPAVMWAEDPVPRPWIDH